MLASLISQGAEIRGTQLTEAFDYASYREKYGKGLIPLFALDGRGELRVFYVGGELEPAPGWTVISLLPPEDEKSASTILIRKQQRARREQRQPIARRLRGRRDCWLRLPPYPSCSD